MQLKGKYIIMSGSKELKCLLKEIVYKLNINNLTRNEEDKNIKMNDIARVSIRTTQPVFIDSYRKNRITGSFILIDEGSYETVAAGMII
jgi:sulfate adenylyltransferase subunit 1